MRFIYQEHVWMLPKLIPQSKIKIQTLFIKPIMTKCICLKGLYRSTHMIVNLKETYHAIFNLYIVRPYLYKVYIYISVFKIRCILAMPHFALCCLLSTGLILWAAADHAPPAGEGSRALISCWAVRRGGEKEISVLRVLLYRVVIHLF